MYIYHNILHNRRTFMISKKYSSMLNNTSIIREFAQYASKRAAEIGAENVFNYTIGNPSVPTTDDFNKGLIDLIQNEDSLALHGYSPTLTIYSVRKAVAESLNRRFGMEYVPEDIFMTSGAAGALAHAIRCVTEPGDEVITFALTSLSMYHTLTEPVLFSRSFQQTLHHSRSTLTHSSR